MGDLRGTWGNSSSMLWNRGVLETAQLPGQEVWGKGSEIIETFWKEHFEKEQDRSEENVNLKFQG